MRGRSSKEGVKSTERMAENEGGKGEKCYTETKGKYRI